MYKFQYVKILLLNTIMCFATYALQSQVIIKGEILDINNEAIDNVNIRNIYTMKGMTVKDKGKFQIEVKKGELVEFTKVGYQTVRIRIQSEKEPLYYKILMYKTPIELREVDIRGKSLDYKSDSIRFGQTYQVVLQKEKKYEVDMRNMPLAMLSKKNRQEWAFQEMYEKWQREKYIDFAFNERLVSRITYLEGDSLMAFMKAYRPTYEFLQKASEYEYLDYIKSSYFHFKSAARYFNND